MKALQINSYGGVEVLQINNDVPKPSCGPNQVLVEAIAASLNPFDWKVRNGYVKDFIKLQFPVTLGSDFSGVIVDIGENVSDFKIGDDVYGQAAVFGGGTGAFAKILAASVDKITSKPKDADFLEAAALPLIGVSALQALETHMELKSKQKILIHGGAGGIGHIAIQLAKSLDAYVATTVSFGDIEFAKEIGADEVIDYKAENFDEKLSDFDAAFDTVGGETTNKSFSVLKKGGILVSMTGAPSEELAQKYGIQVIGQDTEGNRQRLDRLASLVDNGKIKVHIDKVFLLENGKEAFEHLEKNHPRGKVVLKIK